MKQQTRVEQNMSSWDEADSMMQPIVNSSSPAFSNTHVACGGILTTNV